MSARALTIIELMSDERLLGRYFQGDSWDVHRAVLRAGYCLPMGSRDLELFALVSGGRAPPTKPARELVEIGGRRSGKDSIASLMVTHAAACIDHRPYLRPGERALCACFACDSDQAAIVLDFTRAYFRDCPYLRKMIVHETATGFELDTGAEIAIVTNNYRAPRGRAIAIAVFDEVGLWRGEASSTPDIETYRAVRPGTLTLPEARICMISTPYMRSGLLYTKWQKSFGKDDDSCVVVVGASPVFNPTLDQAAIDEMVADDPAAARAEIYAEWRDDISGFLDYAWIERAASLEDGELPPRPGVTYRSFIDASGGRKDAMTIGVSHREGNRVIVDVVRGRRAPFEPEGVVAEFAQVMTRYRCTRAKADRYAGEWVVSAFAKHGKTIEPSEMSKSDIYLEAEPLFAQGVLAIPRSPVLMSELRNLERATHRGGRDTVDHPRAAGSHDDYANSCLGAAWMSAKGDGAEWMTRITSSGAMGWAKGGSVDRFNIADPSELYRRMGFPGGSA